MIELIFLLFACIILARSSKHDYDTMFVKWETPLLLFICGMFYMILSGNNIWDTVGIVTIIAFLFIIPSFFSFGMGDFLIFLGLGFFIDTQEGLSLFLGIFLVLWIVWTVYMLHKHRVDKKGMWKMEYPLVPVIAFAFYVWIMLRLII